jgi:aspartate kinase (monofunctional class)
MEMAGRVPADRSFAGTLKNRMRGRTGALMLIVKKFGGSSVANKERIFNVAKRCIEDYKAGHDVVVVLSAMGDTTDELIELAQSINPNAKKRELDMLMTTGEQVSVSLMAMAMHALDVPAVSLNAFQAGMISTSTYGNARFKRIDTKRIQHELDARKIVIVTGFQGVNKYDDITTLGRGGSDTTAVALAAVLHADKCEIYTDVDGVYTADPRVVKDARKLEAITYDEMLELATLGAKVLHNRSVEMAKKYGVELVVRSSLNRSEGTVIKEKVKMEKMLITGVAADKNTARISVIGVEDKPGTAFKIFNTLAKNHINVDIILQSVGREGTKDISFTVSEDDLEGALNILEEHKEALTIQQISYNRHVAKISVVGAGMMSNPGVAAKMFESLFNSRININMISTSEIRITVLIDEKDIDKAMNAVHEGFALALTD